MLEKFLNKEVIMIYAVHAQPVINGVEKGRVTKISDDFIELNNNKVIAIKYIVSIYEK